MTGPARQAELIDFMDRHGLDCIDVGEILGRSPRTVRCWRYFGTTRHIPRDALQVLLGTKIKKRDR